MKEFKNLRVAVVTPYYSESLDVLQRCHESVKAQNYSCSHILVADGNPNSAVSGWPVEHITLPRAHADNGNTPRAIGSLMAMNQNYDAIAYLDADNWFHSTHIAAMVGLHRKTGALVCTASRNLHRLDGSLMGADLHESDGETHVDTSCLFITKGAFEILPLWAMMPRALAPICDRVFWQAIRGRGFSRAHLKDPTVAFSTQYKVHYENLSEEPPPHTKSNAESTGKAFQWWGSLSEGERQEWHKYLVGGR